MKKLWLGLLAALCLLAGFPSVCRAAEIKESELYSRSACLLDADSGRVLYGKEAGKQMPMASTTKIMTCILALESGKGEELVTVSANAARQPKVHMGAVEGEQFQLKDLLFALMLNSDNDAAVMIAEHVGGSVEGFSGMMNRKAEEIGCEHTYFITPNGLDAEDEHGVHSTTAVDLARILRYCIMESPQRETFLQVTRTPSYTFWNNSHTKTYNCINHNAFLEMMDGALTGKTGFTSDAGYCYVGALEWEGKTLIVSLLACGWPNNKGYKWSDTRKLMTYGLQNYTYRDIFEHKELGSLPVEGGQYDDMRIGDTPKTPIGYEERPTEISFPVLLRQDEQVRVEYQIPKELKAPVKKGQMIGKVQYFLGSELLKEYPVYAKNQVDVLDFQWCLKKSEKNIKCREQEISGGKRMHKMMEELEDCPIIAAVKDDEGLTACLKSESSVIFVLYGDICTIGDIVKKIRQSGKKAVVHMDLIQGLSGKEVSVDFLKKNTQADGIITTRPALIHRAKELGMFTVLRFFVIDSMAYENIQKQSAAVQPDVIEILPGLMPKVIRRIRRTVRRPVIAGGLISEKEDIMAALDGGAVAISTTNQNVWFM